MHEVEIWGFLWCIWLISWWMSREILYCIGGLGLNLDAGVTHGIAAMHVWRSWATTLLVLGHHHLVAHLNRGLLLLHFAHVTLAHTVIAHHGLTL